MIPIRGQIRVACDGFANRTTKRPKNLILMDWQIDQLIKELSELTDSKVATIDSYMDMKIIKQEETIAIVLL